MAKHKLKAPMHELEGAIIETLLASHHEWRPDLAYPESYSDMQGAVRGLLRMFDVKRRPLAIKLEYEGDRPDASPWPPSDVITKLCEATDILLNEKNYDGHGHEEIRYALTEATTWCSRRWQ